jgi:RNase P/RNase MRP subunit p30
MEKNLIISGDARNAFDIREPYDAINICAYFAGLSMERAKVAIPVNWRSVVIARRCLNIIFYHFTFQNFHNEQVN